LELPGVEVAAVIILKDRIAAIATSLDDAGVEWAFG
jgi:hypothetical protein